MQTNVTTGVTLMPKRTGMLGAGSRAMGGGGKKPNIPKTTMMGTPPAPGSPGGMPTGPGAMGGRAAPGAGMAPGGASGIGGFKRGGHVGKEKKEEMREKKDRRHEKK